MKISKNTVNNEKFTKKLSVTYTVDFGKCHKSCVKKLRLLDLPEVIILIISDQGFEPSALPTFFYQNRYMTI